MTMENDSDHPLSDGDALWGELPATTSGDSDEDVTNGSGVPQCHPALSSPAATAASTTTLTDAEEVTSNVNHIMSLSWIVCVVSKLSILLIIVCCRLRMHFMIVCLR